MFEEYFKKYKKEIEFHNEYNSIIDFNEGVEHTLLTQYENIEYIQEEVLTMNNEERKNHFFYILKYKEDDEPTLTYWFEYIVLSRKEFIEHIIDDIELTFKDPLEYIDEFKYNNTQSKEIDNLNIKFFRNWLKNYFFDNSITMTNDFYINLQISVPDYIIYNSLGEIDHEIMLIARNKKETIIQKIVDNIRYTPESLKVMCWNALPIKITNTLTDKIIL